VCWLYPPKISITGITIIIAAAVFFKLSLNSESTWSSAASTTFLISHLSLCQRTKCDWYSNCNIHSSLRELNSQRDLICVASLLMPRTQFIPSSIQTCLKFQHLVFCTRLASFVPFWYHFRVGSELKWLLVTLLLCCFTCYGTFHMKYTGCENLCLLHIPLGWANLFSVNCCYWAAFVRNVEALHLFLQAWFMW